MDEGIGHAAADSRVPPTYYFSYGSNMHLAQMASRCRDSIFVGRGRINGYRIQINQRGVANIVPSSQSTGESFVEGVLFVINHHDIRSLDRSEGVARKFYEKTWLSVERKPLAIENLAGLGTEKAASELKQYRPRPRPPPSPTDHGQRQQRRRPEITGMMNRDGEIVQDVQALVYLSSQYREDDCIRSEYATRLRWAMLDAEKLGLDLQYLENCLAPLLEGPMRNPQVEQPRREGYIGELPGQATGNHRGQERLHMVAIIEISPGSQSREVDYRVIGPERQHQRQGSRHRPRNEFDRTGSRCI